MKKKVIVKLFYAILEIVYNYIRRIKLYYDNLENKEREFITVQRNSFFFFFAYIATKNYRHVYGLRKIQSYLFLSFSLSLSLSLSFFVLLIH